MGRPRRNFADIFRERGKCSQREASIQRDWLRADQMCIVNEGERGRVWRQRYLRSEGLHLRMTRIPFCLR
jgi:hypothetical protein